MFLKLIPFFFLISCSLFQGRSSLHDQDYQKLLNSIKLTGEGKGRLSLGQNQYVFGVDSILNEKQDWIMAVAIPLHGEEVMLLPDLKKKNIINEETESFEERIENEFKALNLDQNITAQEFHQELRSLVRFSLAPAWGGKPDCALQNSVYLCRLDSDEYEVTIMAKEILINKSLGKGRTLQLIGKNLTDSFFTQNDIRLYTKEADLAKKSSSFSLELFW